MFQIAEYSINCNFVNGFEYLDKIGSIVTLFAKEKHDNNNLAFNINNANQELSLHQPREGVREFKINQNEVKLYVDDIQNDESILNNVKYFLNKIDDITKTINVTEASRIGIVLRMSIADEGVQKRIKSAFHKKNIKYFSTSFNEMLLANNIKVNLKLYTGVSPVIPQITTSKSMSGITINAIGVPSNNIMYVLDADIFTTSIGNIKISDIKKEFDNIIKEIIQDTSKLSTDIQNFIFEGFEV